MASTSWKFLHANKPSLKSISILLVDHDVAMLRLVGYFLRSMGFAHVYHAKTAAAAMEILHTRSIDLIITEWLLDGMDGIDLTRAIRLDHNIANRMMPVIMLTGKNETVDVIKARDAGVTEFLIKPFTAYTLYSHLEHVIEQPRSFVLCDVYVGPERRRRAPPPENQERRIIAPEPIQPQTLQRLPEIKSPIILPPNFTLKERINAPLSSLITKTVLDRAQAITETLAEESLGWLQQDMVQLERNFEQLIASPSPNLVRTVRLTALSIKTRAGTFGYEFASQLAGQLHRFMGEAYTPGSKYHQRVADKHIDALRVTFAAGLKKQDAIGAELLHELRRLTQA